MNRVFASLVALCLVACSADLGTLPCRNDGECQTGSYCDPNGKCAVAPGCSGTTTLCHDKCVDLSNDGTNCGTCGTVCAAPAGGSTICAASACSATPGGVEGVTATGSPGQIFLSWSPTAGADAYLVTRSATATGAFAQIASVAVTSYVDRSPADGTLYFYSIAAGISGRLGPHSTPVSATTPLAVPQGLLLTASTSSVGLTWTAVTSATSYTVSRSTDGVTFQPVGNPGTNSYTDNSVQPGTTYWYKVAAVDSATTGSFCAAVQVTTPLAVPTNLTAVARPPFAQLGWTASTNASGYLVSFSLDAGATFTPVDGNVPTTTSTSINVPSNSGTAYQFRVAAWSSVFTSAPSAPVQLVMPLDAPVLKINGGSSTSVSLGWSTPNLATAFQVVRAVGPAGQFQALPPSAIGPGNLLNDNNLTPGTTYRYQVYATNAVDNSGTPFAGTPSNIITYVPLLDTPTGLTAAAQSSTSAVVSWNQVSGATGYNLSRSVNSTNFVAVNASTPNVAGSPFTDSGLTPGTSVQYRVQAYNGNTGNFSASSAAVIIPLDPPTSLRATLTGNTSADLSWTPSFNSGLTNVLRSTEGGPYTQLTQVTGSTFSDSTLSPGTAYSFEVEAVSSQNTQIVSLPSTPVALTSTLSAPALLTVGGTTSTSVTLQWQASTNALKYLVMRQTGGNAATQVGSPSASPFTDAAAAPGTAYTYFVIAQSADTTSGPSNSVLPVTPLDAPSVTANYDASLNINVSWTSSINATSYTLRRSIDNGAFQDLLLQPGTNFTETSPTPGHLYLYKVQATNAAASSPFSASAGAVVPLDTPANLAATTTPTQVSLTWTAVNGAVGYLVLRSPDNVTFTQLGATPSTTTNSSADTTVTGGTRYFYQVKAWTSFTTGGATPSLSVVTPLAAPSPISASYNAAAGNVLVTWAASAGAASYTLQSSTDQTAWTTIFNSNALSFNDVSLSAATTWFYRVQASGGGVLSPYTPAVFVSVPPATPTRLTANTPFIGVLGLTWLSVGGASGYNVYRSTDNGQTYALLGTAPTITTTSYNDYNCVAGTTYFYKVQAYTPISVSALTGAVSNSFAATSVVPDGVTATSPSPSTLNVSWGNAAAPVSPGGYQLLRSFDGVNFSNLARVSAGVLSYSDSTLGPSQQAWYKVEGLNSSAPATPSTAPSAVATATTLQLFPPTALSLNTAVFGQVTLTWTPPPGGADGYNVFSSTDGFTWTQKNTTLVPAGNAAYVDSTAVPAGTLVRYTMQSVLNQGTASPYATSVAGTTQLCTISKLSASTSSAAVVLDWTCPGGASSYAIYRSSDGGANYPNIGSALGTGTTFTDDSAQPGVAYRYEVAAATSQTGGAASAPVAITGPAVFGSPPSGLNLQSHASTSITLTWIPPNGAAPTQYTVARGLDQDNLTPLVGLNALSYNDTGLTPGTLYYYRIQSNYGSGSSSYTAIASAYSAVAPPAGLVGAGAGTQVTLNWQPAPSAISYNVSRGTSSGGPYTNLNQIQSTSLTDTGLTSGTTYYYVVTTNNACCGSPYSAEIAVTPGTAGVAGKRFITYQNGGTVVTVPDDMTQYGPVVAVSQQGAQTTATALTSSDGYFTFANIPQGPYLPHFGGVGYHQTSSRTLDYSIVRGGRPNAPTAQIRPSNVITRATNLGAWQPTDVFEVLALASNFYLFNPQTYPGSLGGPLVGSTSTNNLTMDNDSRAFGGDLLQNDTAYLFQLQTRFTANGLSYQGLTHSAQITAFENDGVDLNLNTPLTDLTTSGPALSTTINWKRSAFLSGNALTAVNPGAAPAQATIAIDTLPGGSANGFFTGSPDLAILQPAVGSSDLNYGAVTYFNPFPSAWDQIAQAAAGVSVSYLLPGAAVPYTVTLPYSYQDDLAPFAANLATGNFGPPITPVQTPTVQGLDAFLNASGLSSTPTVAWLPPTTGTPTHYKLTLYVISNSNGVTSTIAVRPIFTSGTSVTIPKGFIGSSGQSFFFTIEAIDQPGYDLSVPLRGGITRSSAPLMTGIFTQ